MSEIPPLVEIVDKFLENLLPQRNKKPGNIPLLPEQYVSTLVNTMKEVFANEKVLLRLQAPIVICGDTHGQYADLLRMFEFVGYAPANKYLFLGDYVDRGKYSLETICLLFALKLRYPEHVYLLRGNHEDASLNRVYGFFDECKRKYSIKLWKTFVDCFNYMPVAAIINNRILCMHGGLSPSMTDYHQIDSIERPQKIPDEGLMCDLLWSDPDEEIEGWGPNERGVSFVFGKDVVREFTDKNGLDLIVRAHECISSYQFFAGRRLVTIFSAPAYCGDFDNSAGALIIDKNLLCSFKSIEPLTLGKKKS